MSKPRSKAGPLKEIAFSPAAVKEYERIVARYPVKKWALIPVLALAQREFGWLSEDAIRYVADLMEIPPAKVLGVATFYSMLRLEPEGRYVIQVCRNISCFLRGSEKLLRHMEEKLGIQDGGTTADGLFTLKTVECLGACDMAPALQINNDAYRGPMTREKADAMLNDLKEADRG